MLLFASSPLTSAGDVQRDYVKYVIQVERSTVIEGFVVDNNGEGIENASITGWAHSDNISIDVKTDENGYFRIVLSSGEDHEYFLNINENHSGYNGSHPYRGFNKRTVEDTIKSGEHHSLRIPLDYNPFDVELGETSGSLTRGWTPYSYSYTVENRDLTGYTYEQFAGYDASVPNYRTERYISGYEQKWVESGYWVPGYVDTSHWGDWKYAGYSSSTVSKSSYGSAPTGTRYYNYDSTHHGYREKRNHWKSSSPIYSWNYKYRYYEYRRNWGWFGWGSWYYYRGGYKYFNSYKGSSFTEGGSWYHGWKRNYYYRSSSRYVSGYSYRVGYYKYTRPWITSSRWEPQLYWHDTSHWEDDLDKPIYSTRTVQDGYKTTRVPSYTKKWRITVEEWDLWGAVYNGTRTFMVDTEAEAAGYWVGKTYSWGWAGSGEVVLKETFYNLSNGQTVTSQPSAVWETRTSLTEPAKSDSIRNLRANYKITTTRYSVTDYSLAEWGSRQTTVTATSKNGYQGDVRLVAEANSVQATLGSTRLNFSSSAWTTLMMRPYSSTSGSSHPITIRAYDSNERLVETRGYDLNLSTKSKPAAYIWSSTDYRYVSEPKLELDFSIWVSPASIRVYRIDTPASIFDVIVGMIGGEGFSGAAKIYPGERGDTNPNTKIGGIFVHRINGQWIPYGEDKSFWLSSGESAEVRYMIKNITPEGDYYITFRAENVGQTETATFKLEWRYH